MFKVLAIDGGGIRGAFPSQILSLLETDFGETRKHFDLIAGTSTGAIVASAIALGISPARVTQLYRDRATAIFSKRRFSFGGKVRSQYQSTPLRAALHEVFGDLRMKDVPGRLVLPATDISNGNVFVIKSSYLPGLVRDAEIALCDAILASCSAPSYFDPVRIREYLLADGGVWGNNPSLIGITEAVGKLGVAPENVCVLSLGTGVGHRYYDAGKASQRWGLITGWERKKLVDLVLNLQSICAANMASLLLGERYLRINFDETGEMPLDELTLLPQLLARASQCYTYKIGEIRKLLRS